LGVSTSRLSQRQLNRATLARQLLLERASLSAWNAVEWLGGLQAEDVSNPYIALWNRLQGFQPEDLSFALEERRVVAAPLMRGEVHLVTASDYRLWRRALQSALERLYLQECHGTAEEVSSGGLVQAVRAFIADEPRSLAEIEHQLAVDYPEGDSRCGAIAAVTFLSLVQVPPAGIWKVLEPPSYALADGWLGLPTTSPAEGLRHLVVRYLGAFGPAAPEDLEAWAGMAVNESVFEDLSPGLERFLDEDGRTLYDLPHAPRPDESTPAPARMIPKGDNLIHAPGHSARFVEEKHRNLLVGSAGQAPPAFLIDGLVAGTWRMEQTGAGTKLTMVPFRSLSSRETEELVSEGEELLSFIEDEGDVLGVRVEAVL
jgi:hypothetical protein